jgi:hypothetical protein
MSTAGRREDRTRSGTGRAWTAAKRTAVELAIAAAVLILVVAVTDRGEGTASEPDGSPALSETRAPQAQAAILTAEQAHEQTMLCRYEVKATFGVSIFTDTRMSANRLVRLYDGEELSGSCFTVTGGDTIGCAGLSWENQWIRVASGTSVGWSPVSCFERVGTV